jgi:S-DNA-T family DNA segregation ATPase FtsK/SpoIIIE
MANKLKNNSAKNSVDNPKKNSSAFLKPEKEVKVSLKDLAKDERTWKIAGAISLFISLFLFIAFISYFFTWENDQSEIRKGISLFDEKINVHNLLGVLGAFVSHFFIYKGFGIASLLICTFFFIAGVNLLFNRKVWSVWRNVRYVTIGMLVLSVCLAFIFSGSYFPIGGAAGNMIVTWLDQLLGTLGTGALLFVVAFSYIIWQFNPVFKMPQKRTKEMAPAMDETEPGENSTAVTGKTLDDTFTENTAGPAKGNYLKNNGELIILSPVSNDNSNQPEFNIVEKEPGNDFLHFPEYNVQPVPDEKKFPANSIDKNSSPVHGEEKNTEQPDKADPSAADIELEIKGTPQEIKEEKAYENLPPYEPTLDLRDYRYPTLDLLETHGSERIVHDANELENNKNQIIATLRNYDIEIQKIMATVGPTVTLYEIVPAAGIRISRIKNLEDDIALSLAALGIRIIAPIPGKGTIGIEVPNVKKKYCEHEDTAWLRKISAQQLQPSYCHRKKN